MIIFKCGFSFEWRIEDIFRIKQSLSYINGLFIRLRFEGYYWESDRPSSINVENVINIYLLQKRINTERENRRISFGFPFATFARRKKQDFAQSFAKLILCKILLFRLCVIQFLRNKWIKNKSKNFIKRSKKIHYK